MSKKASAIKASFRPRLRVMCGKEIVLGPGRVELLELIGRTGSLKAAAEEMEISYMRAWQLIRYTNRCFREPLVEVVRGGRTGGGAKLTDAGMGVLRLYRDMEKDCYKAVKKNWGAIQKHMRVR